MNLGHLDFDIVSDLELRISDFSLPDNSLPNMMIQPTQPCGYVVPAGLFIATEAQTRRRPRRRVVLNLSHLDFDIVSDFVLRISDFAGLGPSTLVVSALQIHLFMQNKANFRKSQMNTTNLITVDYEKKTLGERGKKQSQFIAA